MSSTTKPTNPKDAIGSDKLPLHLWPATATAAGSIGMLNGALKYGRSNFRVVGVRASIYVDAAQRHIAAWFEGEECDPDDGVPHLAAALSCLAILVDAGAAGKLTDDRMAAGGYHAQVRDLTKHVARLKDLHAHRSPKQYTIADNAAAEPGPVADGRVVSRPADPPKADADGWQPIETMPKGDNRLRVDMLLRCGDGLICRDTDTSGSVEWHKRLGYTHWRPSRDESHRDPAVWRAAH